MGRVWSRRRIFYRRIRGNDTLTTTGIPTQTFFEDGGGQVQLASVFTDPNNPTPTFTYSVVGNTNPALLPNLSFGGQTQQLARLQVNPAANQSGSSVVTVRAEIPGGLYVDASFAVIVQPVNDPPTFVKGPNLVNVINAVPQTVAGWATGVKGGATGTTEYGEAVTFEIVGNSNPDLFTGAAVDFQYRHAELRAGERAVRRGRDPGAGDGRRRHRRTTASTPAPRRRSSSPSTRRTRTTGRSMGKAMPITV